MIYKTNINHPITISLCMIVKSEEGSLARCLESVKSIVDEFIIVDIGSMDNTKGIISKYTDQIYAYEWINHFAAARNYAFSLATKDYVLWLDADDILEELDLNKIMELKASFDLSVDSVSMKYNLSFDSTGKVTSFLRRNRLVERSQKFQWRGAVHEYLQVSGKVIDSDIAITHYELIGIAVKIDTSNYRVKISGTDDESWITFSDIVGVH